VNKQGVIYLSTTGSAVISLNKVLFDGIRLDITANGSFSVSGTAQSLSIIDSTFRSVKTGNTGGALFLNVSSYNTSYSVDTYIANSV
jgi:hypothetical protein